MFSAVVCSDNYALVSREKLHLQLWLEAWQKVDDSETESTHFNCTNSKQDA